MTKINKILVLVYFANLTNCRSSVYSQNLISAAEKTDTRTQGDGKAGFLSGSPSFAIYYPFAASILLNQIRTQTDGNYFSKGSDSRSLHF